MPLPLVAGVNAVWHTHPMNTETTGWKRKKRITKSIERGERGGRERDRETEREIKRERKRGERDSTYLYTWRPGWPVPTRAVRKHHRSVEWWSCVPWSCAHQRWCRSLSDRLEHTRGQTHACRVIINTETKLSKHHLPCTINMTRLLYIIAQHWNPSMRTPLKSGHQGWSQPQREVYKTTPETRTPPLIRILKTVPRVSGIEGFHCTIHV